MAQAAARIGLDLSPAQSELLNRYCSLLWGWNEKINLTRHTSYDLFARRDLLDSMKLAAHLDAGHEILDIGTGGGVPGVVLAILRPDLQVSLCDSVGKKAKVVQEIVGQLQLPIAVYPTRVQSVLEDLRFHSLVTRASGSIVQLLSWVSEHWTQFDRLLAIKGPRWVHERGEARHRGLLAGIDLRCLETYNMPETDSQSVILSLSRQQKRNEQ
jgi:16S rRNA (guanine527-N7)-methyltransferase